MNYDAAFKNIDDTLWKDAGCDSELDYIEQTSWILFLNKRSLAPPMKSKKLLQISRNIYIKKVLKDGDL